MVNKQFAIGNGHVQSIYPVKKMLIFQSDVRLPEGSHMKSPETSILYGDSIHYLEPVPVGKSSRAAWLVHDIKPGRFP